MDRIRLIGWQQRHLWHQLRATRDVRLYRRTLAILELDRGRSIPDVACSLGVDARTVYHRITAYLHNYDPASLCDAPHPGRPLRWDEPLERRLLKALDQSPQKLGYHSVEWTVPLLRDHLGAGDGQLLSDETIRRQLRRLGATSGSGHGMS